MDENLTQMEAHPQETRPFLSLRRSERKANGESYQQVVDTLTAGIREKVDYYGLKSEDRIRLIQKDANTLVSETSFDKSDVLLISGLLACALQVPQKDVLKNDLLVNVAKVKLPDTSMELISDAQKYLVDTLGEVGVMVLSELIALAMTSDDQTKTATHVLLGINQTDDLINKPTQELVMKEASDFVHQLGSSSLPTESIKALVALIGAAIE